VLDAISEILKGYNVDLQYFLIAGLLCTALFVLAYYRFLITIFDPLVFFMITMIASGTLMLNIDTDTAMKVEFFVFAGCCWLGFILNKRADIEQGVFTLDSRSLLELELVLLVLFVVIVAGDLYIGYTVGFPMFSDDPTVAKVEAFTGGAGIFKRFNSTPYQFLAAGCIVMAVLRRRRRFYLALLAISSLAIVLEGSKGSLVPIVAILAFVVRRDGLRERLEAQGKHLMRYAWAALILGAAVALLVSVRSADVGESGAANLGARVVLAGDIVPFYYPNRGTVPDLRGLGPADYVSYLLEGILGMFRLVPYKDPLGTTIMGATNSSFGPNALYFVRADLFFGPYFGCLYCFVIGYGCGWFRKAFFRYRGGSAILLVALLTMAEFAFALAAESQLFATEIFDLTFLLVPLWILARIVTLAIAGPGPTPLVVVGEGRRGATDILTGGSLAAEGNRIR
jgi:hypothetical protein